MRSDDTIVVAFLALLLVGGVWLGLSVRRGRALCEELERRLPAAYEALGRPRPAFFDGPRRDAYLRLVMRGAFAEFDDPQLARRFGALRRDELRHLVFLLLGFGALGAAALWHEFVRTP